MLASVSGGTLTAADVLLAQVEDVRDVPLAQPRERRDAVMARRAELVRGEPAAAIPDSDPAPEAFENYVKNARWRRELREEWDGRDIPPSQAIFEYVSQAAGKPGVYDHLEFGWYPDPYDQPLVEVGGVPFWVDDPLDGMFRPWAGFDSVATIMVETIRAFVAGRPEGVIPRDALRRRIADILRTADGYYGTDQSIRPSEAIRLIEALYETLYNREYSEPEYPSSLPAAVTEAVMYFEDFFFGWVEGFEERAASDAYYADIERQAAAKATRRRTRPVCEFQRRGRSREAKAGSSRRRGSRRRPSVLVRSRSSGDDPPDGESSEPPLGRRLALDDQAHTTGRQGAVGVSARGVNGARPVKRRTGRSKAEMETVREAIYQVLEAERPATVRRVLYAVETRGVIAKSQAIEAAEREQLAQIAAHMEGTT